MVLGLPKWHAQKVVKKCPKSGQKRVPAKSGTIKRQILFGFLTNRGGGLRPPPKNGRGWFSICQKPKPNWCFYGPRFCRDPFLTTFWSLFDHFLGMSFGKAQNHSRTTFWPFLFLGTLGGHLGHNFGQPMLAVSSLYSRCPLEAPKIKIAKKLHFHGFGPSQMTCPKSW